MLPAMADDDFCRDLFGVGDHEDADPCWHWHERALCSEGCSCGHACGEHYRWGGCSLCACLAWEDAGDGERRHLPPRATAPEVEDDDGLDEVAA